MKEQSLIQTKKKKIFTKSNFSLYLLFLPAFVWFFIFAYVPMGGIIVAFKKFYPTLGMFESPFINPLFYYFEKMFSDPYFWVVLRNTIFLNFLRLIFYFPVPIIIALFYNELRNAHLKKSVQIITYLPNFISWIIVVGIIKNIFAVDGFINELIIKVGGKPINFLGNPTAFIVLLLVTEAWKSAGFGSILYLAALSGIDPNLYEAADLDGANRYQKMLYISIPGVTVAVTINFVMFLASFLSGNFDQIYNLYSVPVYDVADIIDTYIYRRGITEGRFSESVALGLVKSVVSSILILIANFTVKKLGGRLLW